MKKALGLVLSSVLLTLSAAAAESPASRSLPTTVKNGTISFALTDRYWAVHQSPDGKVECPGGMNDGPREQFKILFPDDGKKRTVRETILAREGEVWFPTTEPESLVFKEAGGKVSYGMNLDGAVAPDDFTSPDGEPGIDNQLYRAIGCIATYRGPEGSIYDLENNQVRRFNKNRFIIEITGVDSLENDDDVTVNGYRGLDNLLMDASGSAFVPGGTQHIDERLGSFARATWRGRIVAGVLITDPADATPPFSAGFNSTALHRLRGYRFQLRLTPERAEGIMAGYVDVAQFYHHLTTSWSVHHHSYGQLSAASLYRALRRLADGYPDAETGEMTAISSAMRVKFIQIFIARPPANTPSS